jgi:ribosomal protein S18 acetylase RimI-like enzyme
VIIRDATSADVDVLMTLVERLESELPPLPYREDAAEFERRKVERMVEEGVALIAEDEGNPVGYLLARYGDHGPTTVYVSDLWVERGARGRGLGRELMQGVAAAAGDRGCTHLVLDVDSQNRPAIAFYEHLGFEEGAKILRAPVDAVARAEVAERRPSVGAVHVQNDDTRAVEAAVAQFLPRLARESSYDVGGEGSWVAVHVQPFDGTVLRRLARELSDRFGVTVLLTLEEEAVVRFVIHDRGRMVDEYLSIPEFYGPLPPGDAIALRANPTVVSRLTGAEPARVRAVARTADSGGELPPPHELYAQIAELLGVAA